MQSAAAAAAAAGWDADVDDVLRGAFALLPAAQFSHRMTYFCVYLPCPFVRLRPRITNTSQLALGLGLTLAQAQWGRQLLLLWNRRAVGESDALWTTENWRLFGALFQLKLAFKALQASSIVAAVVVLLF